MFNSPRHPAWSSNWQRFLVELDDFVCDDSNGSIGRVRFTDLCHDEGDQVSLDEIELFMRRRLSMKPIGHRRDDSRVYFTPLSDDAEPRVVGVYLPHDELVLSQDESVS